MRIADAFETRNPIEAGAKNRIRRIAEQEVRRRIDRATRYRSSTDRSAINYGIIDTDRDRRRESAGEAPKRVVAIVVAARFHVY